MSHLRNRNQNLTGENLQKLTQANEKMHKYLLSPTNETKNTKISPCQSPNSRGELQYKQTTPKTEPSIKVKVRNIKRKHHLEPLYLESGALKTCGGTFKFQTFKSKYRAIFLKPLNLYVRPASGTFMWNLLTLMWNLALKPLCGTFTRNLYVKLLSGTFMTNLFAKRLCETFMWNFGDLNHSVEPFSGTLEPLFVEPWKTWTFKSGTCWGTWTFKSGTFM